VHIVNTHNKIARILLQYAKYLSEEVNKFGHIYQENALSNFSSNNFHIQLKVTAFNVVV